jgi:hypothetical protein
MEHDPAHSGALAFGERIRGYYEHARENDLLATHTLVPPQVNRSVSASQQGGGQLTAHVAAERDDGVVVRGARLLATLGPIADELLVFPSTVLRGMPDDGPYSFAFAIANDTPGLRYYCRAPLHNGGSAFDEPLASRFEEMDAVAVFDDVLVPHERIFMLGHPELCNAWYSETGAGALMAHQVVTRTLAKTPVGHPQRRPQLVPAQGQPAAAGNHPQVLRLRADGPPVRGRLRPRERCRELRPGHLPPGRDGDRAGPCPAVQAGPGRLRLRLRRPRVTV